MEIASLKPKKVSCFVKWTQRVFQNSFQQLHAWLQDNKVVDYQISQSQITRMGTKKVLKFIRNHNSRKRANCFFAGSINATCFHL